MESLIIYSIIFFIILISLMILYISLNPLEIKDKNIENFYAADDDELPPFVPKVLQGLSPDTYIERNVEGTSNEKYILIKKNTIIEFPKDFPNCQILIVGGGGSGAGQISGGGGGGAVIYITNATINSGIYNIVVGTGGAQTTVEGDGNKGGYSSFAGIIAEGGGRGGRFVNKNPGTGGSGGGADADDIDGLPFSIGASVGNQSTLGGFNGTIYGNKGGDGLTRSGGYLGGGGGGGAGEIGQNGNPNKNGTGGRGGNGIQINITGTNYYWGAGGGGAQYTSTDGGISSRAGNGGLGGGGGGGASGGGYVGSGGTGGLNNGGNGSGSVGGNGGANTGSGGGGGGWVNSMGGAGGSGVVIIRYKPIKQELPLVTARNPADINLSLNTELNNILTARKPFTLFSKINKDINVEFNYYVQEALIQDAIGVEKYTVAYSSYINETTSPLRLFSYDNTITTNTGAQFGINRYDKTTGLFITSVSKPLGIKYIINVNNKDVVIDNQLYGDWVFIKFPTPFILVQYGFVANMAYENKAPGDWVLLGRDSLVSNNNSAYSIIDKANTNSNKTCTDLSCDDGRKSWRDYANKETLLNVNLLDNKKKCNEYLFIFTRLAYSDLRNNKKEGHQLHFKEIRMRSRE